MWGDRECNRLPIKETPPSPEETGAIKTVFMRNRLNNDINMNLHRRLFSDVFALLPNPFGESEQSKNNALIGWGVCLKHKDVPIFGNQLLANDRLRFFANFKCEYQDGLTRILLIMIMCKILNEYS